jgi:hypothetical protein
MERALVLSPQPRGWCLTYGAPIVPLDDSPRTVYLLSVERNSETKRYLTLRDKWYSKLGRTGFDEIEIIKKGKYEQYPQLKRPMPEVQRTLVIAAERGGPEYYEAMATYVRHDRGWLPAQTLLKRAMELHCDGLTGTEISKRLSGKMSRVNIDKQIARIRKELYERLMR